MNSYLLLFSKYSLFDLHAGEHGPKFGCREFVIYYIRYLMNKVEEKDYPNINFYFGHTVDKVTKTVVDKYIPFANEIWKDKVNVSLVNLYDIEDSPDVEYCKKPGTKYDITFDSALQYKDVPLVKITGAVNPLDVSLLLLMSWFGKEFSSDELEKYYLAKKHTDLIQDSYTSFDYVYSPYSRSRVNGPETYMTYLDNYNKTLYNQINENYLLHKGE
jgi:hypothetical protein